MINEKDVFALKAWLDDPSINNDADGPRFLSALCDLTITALRDDAKIASFEREAIFGDEIRPTLKGKSRQQRLSRAAQKAERFLEEGRSRYHEAVAAEEINSLALATADGKGGGKAARHYLVRYEADQIASGDLDNSIPAPGPGTSQPGAIAYRSVPRNEIKLSIQGRLLFGNEDMKPGDWRRTIYMWRIGIDIAFTTIIIIAAVLGLTSSSGPLTGKQFGSVVTALLFATLTYFFTIKPLNKLDRQRMIMLDDHWLKINEPPAVLEKVRASGTTRRAIFRIARYQSECGICGSEVILRDGGARWPERIVGSCINSSMEHVYDFDRFSLKGRPILAAMTEGPDQPGS